MACLVAFCAAVAKPKGGSSPVPLHPACHSAGDDPHVQRPRPLSPARLPVQSPCPRTDPATVHPQRPRDAPGGRPHQPEPAPEAPPCAAARPAAGAGCQPRPEPPRPRLSSCVASVSFPTANDAFVLLPKQNTDEEQPVNSTRARPALGRRDWARRAGAAVRCRRAAGRELRPGA